MDSLAQWESFLGWCLLLNSLLLLIMTIGISAAGVAAKRVHGKLFQLDDAQLSKEYFHYLANYKIAILIFNLVPYCVLRIMA